MPSSPLTTERPEPREPLDVVASSHRGGMFSSVDEVHDEELVIEVPRDRKDRPVRLAAGETMEIIWRSPDGMVGMPVQLASVEDGPRRRLRLRITGRAFRTQRRAAVRAPLVLPVQLDHRGRQLMANSLDISEGGLRVLVEDPVATDTEAADAGTVTADADDTTTPHGNLRVGDRLGTVVTFDDFVLECSGEVVRRHPRKDGAQEVSILFVDLPAASGDLIRRQVFARLRDLRARGLM